MMLQEERRTDLEIPDSVKRYYCGAVLARQLRQVGQDSTFRFVIPAGVSFEGRALEFGEVITVEGDRNMMGAPQP